MHIKLQSRVKDLCDLEIVKHLKTGKKSKKDNKIRKPEKFRFFILDVLCGQFVKDMSTSEYFDQYAVANVGSLSEEEFYQGVYGLGIQISQKQAFLFFRYMLDQQYQKLLSDEKKNLNQHNSSAQGTERSSVGELSGRELVKNDQLDIDFLQHIIQSEVQGSHDDQAVRDEVLKDMASELSKEKTPVKDIIDAFRSSVDAEYNPVTEDEFRYKILTSLLKLKNMSDTRAEFLTSLYTQAHDGTVDVDSFIDQLLKVGYSNFTPIFLTQQDIQKDKQLKQQEEED